MTKENALSGPEDARNGRRPPQRTHVSLRAKVADVIVVAMLGLLGSALTSGSVVFSSNMPNIVLITTDDQTLATMWVLDNVRVRIGGNGTTYTQYYGSFPLCCPMRATLMTGQYAHNHGVDQNGGGKGGGYREFRTGGSGETNSLPVWLQDAGYRTGFLGKFMNGYAGYAKRASMTPPPGWDDWRASISGNYRRTALNVNGHREKLGGEYKTAQYGDIAVDRINQFAAGAEPYFFWVALNAPHTGGPREPGDPKRVGSANVQPKYRDTYAGRSIPTGTGFNEADISDKPRHIRAAAKMDKELRSDLREAYTQQLEALESVDDTVNRILNAVSKSGEGSNTVVMFTSDNGYFYGEHRIKAGKVLPYEPSAHLPLLVKGPGFAPGATSSNPRSDVDLAATIVDIAGATPGRTLDGTSLKTPVGDSRPILHEGKANNSAGVKHNIVWYSAIRTPDWLYSRYEYTDGGQSNELYRLTDDPNQLRSLHKDPAFENKRQQLADRLADIENCSGDACP